jgi:methylphosphotriester-DNA--protein-cysteine methyltransferase
VDFVVETLAAGTPRPLIDACGHVLVPAVLSCFARPGRRHQPRSAIPAYPCRRRAVQYLFRKHLDVTPTEHLRRVRLQRDHLDLLAGHRSTTTVSEVARRWGFGHTGRFAVQYRETYGVSPHMTLRG